MSLLRKCVKCIKSLPKESFALRVNGERTLRCIECLKEDEVEICHHNLIKTLCTDCSEFCEHERDITTCKLCCDPIPIIVRNMVRWNLQNDKQKGMYDAVNCVDEDHVLELIWIAQGSCYYCKCSLQYIHKQDNLASLERLTNSLGHVKGNCVISCLKCNRTGVGEKIVRRPTKKRALQVADPLTFFEKVEKISTSFPATQTSSMPVEEKKVPTKKQKLTEEKEIELFL